MEDAVVDRARARIGSVLKGKYRLDRVLGVGGMAAVYAATHRNSKRFAVKMLHPELSLRSDIRLRFLREGYVATQVEHPGAVTVLDDDVAEDGSAFLVMELLDGTTVDALWEQHQQKLPLSAVLAIGHQLLDVLAAAHDRGIVHRDIKPENLFVTIEGQLKVLDFGIARLKDAASSSATSTGLVMGTPAFMAPEQALGTTSEVGPQSDIWAVGAVLFTLASGRYVHEGESAQHVVVQAATKPARSLARVWPDAPKDVVQLVDSALAFEKSARWATASAMQRGVAAAARATTGSGPSRNALVKLLSEQPSAPAPVESSASEARTAPRMDVSTDSGLGPEGDAPTRIQTQEPEVAPAKSIAPPPRRPAGLTTEQPVSHDSDATRRWPLRRTIVWAGIGAGAVALAALAGFAMRGHVDDVPAKPASAAPTVAPPPSAAVRPAAPQEDLIEPATLSLDQLPKSPATDTPAAPAAAPANPARQASPPVTTPPAPPPVKPAVEPGGPRPAPVTTAQPPPATAQGKINCTPPFTLDPVTGKKKWKAECL